MNRLPTRAEWEQGESQWTITARQARNACFTGLLAGMLFCVVTCILMP